MEKIIGEYGVSGYGLYFYCLEIIAGTVEADNITFELEPDAEILARRLAMDTVQVEKIMHRCIELGLFEVADNGRITCMKMTKFFDTKMTSNPEMRKIFSGAIGESPTVTDSHRSGDQIRLDKNRIEEKKEEREDAHISKPGGKRIDAHIKTWNGLGLPTYRYTSLNMREKDRADSLRTLSVYGDEEIAAAIRNYSEISNSSEHEAFPVYPTFAGFLATGIEKYADDAKPFDRCKKKPIGYARGDDEGREAALKHLAEIRGEHV